MLIYKPRGHASEYAALALNIWNCCSHRCGYCYCPRMLKMTPEEFAANPRPRQIDLRQLHREASQAQEEILLSFTSDPYQPAEKEAQHTRRVLQVLVEEKALVTVLTKNPELALRDIDLFQRGNIRIGTTIVFADDIKRQKYEPGAPPIESRIAAVQEFKAAGIPTWISLEPVIDCQEALEVIRTCGDLFDEWKIGKVNHIPQLEKQDWRRFCKEALKLLAGRNYMFKSSLTPYLASGEFRNTLGPRRLKGLTAV